MSKWGMGGKGVVPPSKKITPSVKTKPAKNHKSLYILKYK